MGHFLKKRERKQQQHLKKIKQALEKTPSLFLLIFLRTLVSRYVPFHEHKQKGCPYGLFHDQ